MCAGVMRFVNCVRACVRACVCVCVRACVCMFHWLMAVPFGRCRYRIENIRELFGHKST
jgi:hypothetical protein